MHLYFPIFNEDELNLIFTKYINSERVHINYLQAILDTTSSELLLTDEIRLLALQKINSEQKKLFNKNTGMKFGSIVGFGDFKEVKSFKNNGTEFTFQYDTKWIKGNLDFPTLLNNFIYLFEFVDSQMRFQNVSKPTELGLFENLFGVHTKYEYKTGMMFKVKEMTLLMQMMQYERELLKNKSSIEKCISWFYKNYLKQEFAISDFLVHMPKPSVMSFEKCRIIFPEIDGILKQFSIYQKLKKIDHDLMEVSTSSVPFENIKSLNVKKYVYVDEEKTAKLFHLLFSDQSTMHYIEGYEKYNTFFDLITNEKIKYNAIKKNQEDDFMWLKKNGYIKRNKNGFIEFKDIVMIYILKDLYENEVISYMHYPIQYQKRVDYLVKKNLCYFDNHLFSKPEVKYLNFYLNNRMVSNGLSLRNRYGHGTQPRKDNKKVHDNNYLYLLYIIVLITIKINDDLCLFDENNKHK